MPVRKLKASAKKLVKKLSGGKAASKPAAASATKAAKPKKHVGDVLGISTARVPKGTPRATKDTGGRPKGIELPAASRPQRSRRARLGRIV
jgi:hypothetical protein